MLVSQFEETYGKIKEMKESDGFYKVYTVKGKCYKLTEPLQQDKVTEGLIIVSSQDEKGLYLKNILDNKEQIITQISDNKLTYLYTKAESLVGLKNELTLLVRKDYEFIEYLFSKVKEFRYGRQRVTLSNNLKLKLLQDKFLNEKDLNIYVNNSNRAIGDTKSFIEYILRTMAERGISDCSMAVNSKIKYRVNKELVDDENYEKLTPADLWMLHDEILNICSLAKRHLFGEKGYTRVSMSLANCGRYRIVMTKQRGTPAFSIRYIPFKIRALKDFRLPKLIQAKFLKGQGGLYIIAGVPNSGKSTLAASIIDNFTLNTKKKIITLENPIEYLFRHNAGQTVQIEIGEDVRSYAEAVEMLLTFDPDIVYITEIKNSEELLNAIDMATAGKYVISSTHAGSVKESLTRLRSMLAGNEIAITKFSTVLRLIMVQQLVPAKNGGMVPAQEILNIKPDFRASLEKNQLHSLRSLLVNQKQGNRSMENDLWNLKENGVITEEVFKKTVNTEVLRTTGTVLYKEVLDNVLEEDD